ncbi:hypothetical protein KY358_00720, partial [Candidatus Woesearchaeota archaeon]|nr:hypothetical protein [Candidatus Woesearchaeota archaeon]
FGSLPRTDLVNAYTQRIYILRESIGEYNDLFPLWNPYTFSGTQLFANPSYSPLYYTFPLIISNVLGSLKMIIFFSLFLAGVFMYAFVFYLLKDHESAFIAGLIYTINPWINSRIEVTHLTTIAAYAYIPIILLFTFKALKSKKWLHHSIIAGIFLALQVLSGPDLKVPLWTAPIFLFAILSYLIGNKLPKRATKAFLVTFFVIAVCFGLIAFKALPTMEYVRMSSASRQDFSMTLAGRINLLKEGFQRLIQPFKAASPAIRGYHVGYYGYHIGIVAFLLILFAIVRKYNNKNVLFFLSVILFFLFIITGSFLWRLMWQHLPLYSSFRFLHRTVLMFVFAGSALAAYGFYELKCILKRKNWSQKRIYLAFVLIAALIILNLAIYGPLPYRNLPWRDPVKALEGNYLLHNISKEPGIFRIHVYETNGIDWGTDFQNIPLGIESLYGYDGIWLKDYMNEYLSVAFHDRAKFWGMLNTKFVTSTTELNISGLRFYKKFKNCTTCWPETPQYQKLGGPYLYINEEAMPRAYLTEDAVLIVGERDSAKQMMYALMVQEEFNPKNIAVVLGREKINDYEIEELADYNAIILAKDSVDSNSLFKLEQYYRKGGKVIPNIIEGKNQILPEDLQSILTLSGAYHPISDGDVKTINFDHRRISLPSKKGFLVLSEKFSMYPGWEAYTYQGQKEIMRSNGVLSAIKVNEDDEEMNLEFKPGKLKIGVIILIVTITLIIAYFAYEAYSSKKKDGERIFS